MDASGGGAATASSSSTSVGEGVVRRKKKWVVSGGQKWFKGSPKKNSSRNNSGYATGSGGGGRAHQKAHLIQSAVLGAGGGGGHENNPPPALPTPLVQFSLDGVKDFTFSVFDQLSVTSKSESDETDCSTPSNNNNVSRGARAGGSAVSGSSKKKKAPDELVLKGKGVKSTIASQIESAGGLLLAEGGGTEVKEERRLPQPLFRVIDDYELKEAPGLPNAYIRWIGTGDYSSCDDQDIVEYDVDEEDSAWLELFNSSINGGGGRKKRDPSGDVALEVMEVLMDRLEKESYLQMESSGLDGRPVIDDDAVCSICMDGECQNSNAILFCDMCNLAVHQECYGVPYIPEGQWLCRRCLQSPSRAVDCVLCPNKGGAFKQTDDGRWAHVVCAIWIPEVCFANTVFLEPVDSVNNIPAARWRLSCFICKYKGRGACIQCHKSNCYIAFHVTCAQHAGLCMKMETVRIGSQVTVRKTAFCDNHAPADFIRNRDGDSPTVRQKLKACRKMLAEKRSAIPMVSIPTIPPERLEEIASSVSFPRKIIFIQRLLAYWKLKRIKRNGVPLLRRLQAASNHPPSTHHSTLPLLSPNHRGNWDAEYKYLMRLRQDLERARLLCELIRKREKLKREEVVVRREGWNFEALPIHLLMHNVLKDIGQRDTLGIFAHPVDPEEVPDYLSVIHHPIDLSTMAQKIDSFQYVNLKALQADFQLMIDNCLLYNSKDTVFYRTGMRIGEVGRMIFREAERIERQVGYDYDSGLHRPSSSSPTEERTMTRRASTVSSTPSTSTTTSLWGIKKKPEDTDEEICSRVDAYFNSLERFKLPLTSQIYQLDELQEKVLNMKVPLAKKQQFDRISSELKKVVALGERLEEEVEEKEELEEEPKPQRRTRLLSTTNASLSPPRQGSNVGQISPEQASLKRETPQRRRTERRVTSTSSSTTTTTPRLLRNNRRGGEEGVSTPKNKGRPTRPSVAARRLLNSPADQDDEDAEEEEDGEEGTKSETREGEKKRRRSNRRRISVTTTTTTMKSPSSRRPAGGRRGIGTEMTGGSLSLSPPSVKQRVNKGATTNNNNNEVKVSQHVISNGVVGGSTLTRPSASSPTTILRNGDKVPLGGLYSSSSSPSLRKRGGAAGALGQVGRGDSFSVYRDRDLMNSEGDSDTEEHNSVHHEPLLMSEGEGEDDEDGEEGAEPPPLTPPSATSAAHLLRSNTNNKEEDEDEEDEEEDEEEEEEEGSSEEEEESSSGEEEEESHRGSPSPTRSLRGGREWRRPQSNDGGGLRKRGKTKTEAPPTSSSSSSSSNSESEESSEEEGHSSSSTVSSHRPRSSLRIISLSSSADLKLSKSKGKSWRKNSRKKVLPPPPPQPLSSHSHHNTNHVNEEEEEESEGAHSNHHDEEEEEEEDEEENGAQEQRLEPPPQSDQEEEEDEEDESGQMGEDVQLKPLQLVWATGKEGAWVPALIIDPHMGPNFSQNGVVIPVPPSEVLERRPTKQHRMRRSERLFLILFFNNRNTWEWVFRSELVPLGVSAGLDQKKLEQSRKQKELKWVRKAYEKAILHRHQLSGVTLPPAHNNHHGFSGDNSE